MGILPKIDVKKKTVPIKMPAAMLAKIDKVILKFMLKCMRLRIEQNSFKKAEF